MAILICGIVLIISVLNVNITEIKVGKKTNHCPNVSLVFPIILINILAAII